jgi:hypothetical protein
MMQGSTSVAANATSTNVLAGNLFEFTGNRPARISLYSTGSATGLNVTLVIQGRVSVQDSAIGLQNRFPIIPDDFVVKAAAMPKERLVLTFRNTTGGALTAFWQIQITYL